MATFNIIHDYRKAKSCCQLQKDIFHGEMGLLGMSFPDKYDPFSVYVEILESELLIGAYRIIFPNEEVGLPIQELWDDSAKISINRACEWSRFALSKKTRGKISFGMIMDFSLKIARQEGMSTIMAVAMLRSSPFFEKHGFRRLSNSVYDATIDRFSSGVPNAVPISIEI